MIEVGKKYNERTLYRMRKFYEVFKNEKLTPLVSKLSWSHYIQLLFLKNEDDRLSHETKLKLIKSKNLMVNDLVPNPIIIKSNLLKEEISEYALKQTILNNLDNFLVQLGMGFTYVGNEYKIKLGDRYNYIDKNIKTFEEN